MRRRPVTKMNRPSDARRRLYRRSRRVVEQLLVGRLVACGPAVKRAARRFLRHRSRHYHARIVADRGFALAVAAALAAGVTASAEPPIELSDVAAGIGGFVINGIDPDDEAGRRVAGAGDVNGDGLADLLVSAYRADANGVFYAGESYVVFGKADGTPVELSDIAAGIGGFIINGIDPGDESGANIAGAGDVNGDGLDDVLVSSYKADPGGNSNAGETYVIFGKADGTPVNLADIVAGTGGFVITGIDPEDDSGDGIGGAGDVNGDGLADVIVGAIGAAPNGLAGAGESYVVFGKAGGAAVDLADVAAGIGGFVINGAQAGDRSGRGVAGAGDVNGDGLDDVIVGAALADPGGRAYVVFGKEDGSPVELADLDAGLGGGFTVIGIEWFLNFSFAGPVSAAGDVNNDGLADVIIAEHSATPGGESLVGESYVVFGKPDGTPVDAVDIVAGIGGFAITGAGAGDTSGYSVSGAGDMDADGMDDLIIGAPQADPNGINSGGESSIVWGKADGAAVDLEDVIAGVGGFVINGIDIQDFAGRAVAGAGDVDGDGLPDVIVGAPLADPGGVDKAGEAYVIFSPITFGELHWDVAGNGTFQAPDDWLEGVVPGSEEIAIFDDTIGNQATATVFFAQKPAAQTSQLHVTANAITFNMSAALGSYAVLLPENEALPSILVSGPPVGQDRPALVISNDAVNELSGTTVSLGRNAGEFGLLVVDGGLSTLNASGELFIGEGGRGKLQVVSNGTLLAAGARIGMSGSESPSELLVTGGGLFQFGRDDGNFAPGVLLVGNGSFSVENTAQVLAPAVGTHIDRIVIGTVIGSTGSATITGAGSVWNTVSDDFVVGEGGHGMLDISQGGTLETTTTGELALAVDAGSSAQVTITGAGSRWTENLGQVNLGAGATVEVTDGGLFEVPVLNVRPDGAVQGNGAIAASGFVGVFNVGTIRPGAAGASPGSTGTLTIDGNYSQIGQAPGGEERSGSMHVDVDGGIQTQDALLVTGTATLGGGLFVEVTGDPGTGMSFEVLSAGAIAGQFDVVFTPGLANQKFMRLGYGSGGAAPGPQTATIVVENLNDLFGFGDVAPVNLFGTPTDVVVADFDGQLGLDVAVSIADAAGGNVLILCNDGSGGLGGCIQVPVGNELTGIAAGDLDGDQQVDIAVSNRDGDNAFVLVNPFGGLPIEIAGVGDGPEDIAVADFGEDANGDLDLIVANGGDDTLQVVNNNGGGIFGNGALIPLNIGANVIAVDPSDLDNDKDADALAANFFDGTVSVIMNLGNGNFATRVDLPVGSAPADMASRDFDGDGLSDIVTANSGDGTVSVLLNNSTANTADFAPAVNLPVGDVPQSLTPINLEGDADIDLAVVTGDVGSRVVKVLRNDLTDGQLIFADAAELAAGDDPALVAAGDMDNDVDTQEDLVTINGVSGSPAFGGPPPTLTVRPNAPCPWDCGDENGTVEIIDFLSLLAEWGASGTPCDFGAGAAGVGIEEFLALLAHWGDCAS